MVRAAQNQIFMESLYGALAFIAVMFVMILTRQTLAA